MRMEEKARRFTRVFYGLLFHKMFQSIAASFVPLFDSRASTGGHFLRIRLSPPGVLLERKARLGASFKRCTIRDGCRYSAPFDSIVT
jgi:hypothetical protein